MSAQMSRKARTTMSNRRQKKFIQGHQTTQINCWITFYVHQALLPGNEVSCSRDFKHQTVEFLLPSSGNEIYVEETTLEVPLGSISENGADL